MTTLPTPPAADAVFVSEIVVVSTTATDSLSSSVTTVPLGDVPATDAVLSIEPASTSACVTL